MPHSPRAAKTLPPAGKAGRGSDVRSFFGEPKAPTYLDRFLPKRAPNWPGSLARQPEALLVNLE